MIDRRLTDKVALITGGAKRVGRSIAIALAREGMHIAITYNHSESDAQSTVEHIQQLGRQAVAIHTNLEQPTAPDQIFREFNKHFDRIDALVNNASIFGPTPLDTLTDQDFDRYLTINARAPLMLTRRFAPLLAARHDDGNPPHDPARVVNLIDTHVMGQSLPNHAAYSASKAALMQVTATCALDLAPHITVNAIAPGVVAWAPSYTPEQQRKYLERVPLARTGTPDDVALAAVYLIRDAHYCTGHTIQVDGGRHLT